MQCEMRKDSEIFSIKSSALHRNSCKIRDLDNPVLRETVSQDLPQLPTLSLTWCSAAYAAV